MPENYITCQDEKGSINISEDVVAAMVRAAITEVDGVAGVATSTGTELAELLGIKSAAKGIKVQIVDGTMTVDTIITPLLHLSAGDSIAFSVRATSSSGYNTDILYSADGKTWNLLKSFAIYANYWSDCLLYTSDAADD